MDQSDREFLDWVKGYEDWYDSESKKWVRLLALCKFATLIASIVSIVLAASVTKEFFGGWGKWLIVAGTVLSVISSELMAQFQIRRMEDIRESGHIEASHLCAYSRDKFDEYSGDRARIYKIKDEVRERIRKLEEVQHRTFVDINAEQRHEPDRKKDGA